VVVAGQAFARRLCHAGRMTTKPRDPFERDRDVLGYIVAALALPRAVDGVESSLVRPEHHDRTPLHRLSVLLRVISVVAAGAVGACSTHHSALQAPEGEQFLTKKQRRSRRIQGCIRCFGWRSAEQSHLGF
jgi:hypothetical protein